MLEIKYPKTPTVNNNAVVVNIVSAKVSPFDPISISVATAQYTDSAYYFNQYF